MRDSYWNTNHPRSARRTAITPDEHFHLKNSTKMTTEERIRYPQPPQQWAPSQKERKTQKISENQTLLRETPAYHCESLKDSRDITWWIKDKLKISSQDIAKLSPEVFHHLEDLSVLDYDFLREIGISPLAAKKIDFLSTYVRMSGLQLPDQQITLRELKQMISTGKIPATKKSDYKMESTRKEKESEPTSNIKTKKLQGDGKKRKGPVEMPFFIYSTLSKKEIDDYLELKRNSARIQWYDMNKSEIWRRLSTKDRDKFYRWYDENIEGKINIERSFQDNKGAHQKDPKSGEEKYY